MAGTVRPNRPGTPPRSNGIALLANGDLEKLETKQTASVENKPARHHLKPVNGSHARTKANILPPPPPPVVDYHAPDTKEAQLPPPPPPLEETAATSPTSLATNSVPKEPLPPLKPYAEGNVRALAKNPIYADIMKAAEKFKGRREETMSIDNSLNSIHRGEPTAEYEKVVNYLKPSTGTQHPVYDPVATRKNKKNSFIVNSEETWSRPRPVERKNTFVVVPHYPTSSRNLKPLKSSKTSEDFYLDGISSINDVPDLETLLQTMPRQDASGNTIPDWKRQLMARNHRVKLCEKFS